MLSLKKIVVETGARIVLSSTWRSSEITLKKVNDSLEKYGIMPCMSVTGDLNDRASEIIEWVDFNKNSISAWVALDDLLLETHPRMHQRFVFCESYQGLDDELAQQAITLIRNQLKGLS
jgi:hypothetical protein